MSALTAAALGLDDTKAQAALRGRRFQARIRFGCNGAANPMRADGWTFDADEHVLRVRISADITADSLSSSDLVGPDYEGAVGFTLRRPLLLQAGCPRPEWNGFSAGPTLAIVQLFNSTDSRVQRPPPSYDMTLQIDPTDVPTNGLDLVIEGRLAPLPDRRPIHCAASDGPAACIISAAIDRIGVEDPSRKTLIGEWVPG